MKKPLLCVEWNTVIPSCEAGILSPKFDLKSDQYELILTNYDDYHLCLDVEGCETREGCECLRCFKRITECVRCTVVVSGFPLKLPHLPVREYINLQGTHLCTIALSDLDMEAIRGKNISFLVVLEEDGGPTLEEEEADWSPKSLHSLPRDLSPGLSPSSFHSLCADFAKLLDDPRTADIQLLCRDLTIPAHRIVLTARSEVFEKMLHQTGSIEIPDIEPRIVKEFLWYLYTGTLMPEPTVEQASLLYEAGEKYNVRSLLAECSGHLCRSLTENNIEYMQALADNLGDSNLKARVADILYEAQLEEEERSSPEYWKEQDEDATYNNMMNSVESLSGDFAKLLDDPRTADIKLLCGYLIIPAHKTILSARSEVFEKMLQTDMVERLTGSITIPDIDSLTIKEFLLYIYSGTLPDEMTVERALRLYEAGDKYNVRSLVAGCGRYLGRSLTRDNACEVLVLADNHSDSDLKNKATTFLSLAVVPLKSGIWREFSDEYPKLAHETKEFANEFMKYKTSLNPVTQYSCIVYARRYMYFTVMIIFVLYLCLRYSTTFDTHFF